MYPVFWIFSTSLALPFAKLTLTQLTEGIRILNGTHLAVSIQYEYFFFILDKCFSNLVKKTHRNPNLAAPTTIECLRLRKYSGLPVLQSFAKLGRAPCQPETLVHKVRLVSMITKRPALITTWRKETSGTVRILLVLPVP